MLKNAKICVLTAFFIHSSEFAKLLIVSVLLNESVQSCVGLRYALIDVYTNTTATGSNQCQLTVYKYTVCMGPVCNMSNVELFLSRVFDSHVF